MTKVIARVHPVHLMNADWAPGGRQHSDQASRLGLWVRRKLAAIIHIHHSHCYYYSARKLILILPPHDLTTAVKPVLKTVYRSSRRDKHNCQRRDSNLGPLTPPSDAPNTRLLVSRRYRHVAQCVGWCRSRWSKRRAVSGALITGETGDQKLRVLFFSGHSQRTRVSDSDSRPNARIPCWFIVYFQ